MQISLLNLMDEQACYEVLRQLRWADGVQCPHCGARQSVKDGMDETHSYRQRYRCQSCEKRFDDLTDTVFSGSHQPLKTWIVCLYLMGLNLSNAQIAKELEVSEPTAQQMTRLLRVTYHQKCTSSFH
jgi:transposase-like protein